MTLYELIARRDEAASNGSMAEMTARLEMFARARELYKKRRWEEAQKAFQDVLGKWPEDGPSRVYWKRCQEYLFEEPPANWDGVYVMTHK